MTEITRANLLSRAPFLMKKYPSLLKSIPALRVKVDDCYSMGLLLEHNAQKFPRQSAIIFEDQDITYHAFNEQVNRIANYLLAKGLKQGDAVGLVVENRPEFLYCLCATMKIGAIAALINTHLRKQALAHCLNVAKANTFLVGEEVWEAFGDIEQELTAGEHKQVFMVRDRGQQTVDATELLAACASASTKNPPTTATIKNGDLCGYVYTSGTTGLPKAALLTHKRLMKGGALFARLALNTSKKDRLYIPLPFYHSTALNIGWSVAMNAASAIVISRKFSASRYWDEVRRHQVTILVYVGEVCRYLMNAPEKDNDADNPAVKMVGSGMRPDIWRGFKQRFNIKEVYEFYGASDGNLSFVNMFNFDETLGVGLTPFAIVQYDTDADTPVLDANGRMIHCAVGEVGLALGKISETYSFDGYTNKEDSEKKILRNVFEPGDAWFNSGDLLRNIGMKHAQFVDRIGDTYRWRGENVATSEVEGVVNRFAGVEECTAYGVEIPGTDGRAGMVSIVLGSAARDFDLAGLLTFMRQQLPAYAVPIFLRFQGKLELTGTFKHLKGDLKKEGFASETITDSLYVLLPQTDAYTALTDDIQARIKQREYRF
jgi:citronellyl-CoA synthetase